MPLAAICSEFPKKDPAGLVPIVRMTMRCSTTNTPATRSNLRAKTHSPARSTWYWNSLQITVVNRFCEHSTPYFVSKRVVRYFSQAPFKNKYLARCSSLPALDCAFKNITWASDFDLYSGHFGNPAPFGSPCFAKFVQYFRTKALSALSSALHRSGIRHSSVPNTYSISQEWNAHCPPGREGSSGGARSK